MDLFWPKVEKSSGCWEWQASRDGFGYGTVQFDGRVQRAHRVSWQLTRGRIPTGKLVLHRCDNPRCVRPDHLFLGTQRDNVRDAIAKGRYRGGRPKVNPKSCPNGHHFTRSNAYVDRRGYKSCRTCRRVRKRVGPLRPATHCKHGHPWETNTKFDSNGYRVCISCRKDALRRHYERKRNG